MAVACDSAHLLPGYRAWQRPQGDADYRHPFQPMAAGGNRAGDVDRSHHFRPETTAMTPTQSPAATNPAVTASRRALVPSWSLAVALACSLMVACTVGPTYREPLPVATGGGWSLPASEFGKAHVRTPATNAPHL